MESSGGGLRVVSNVGQGPSVAKQLQSGVVDIFANRYAFAALKKDGSVVTWGRDNSGGDKAVYRYMKVNNQSKPVKFKSISAELQSGVKKVFATGSAFAALKSDGSVVAWGAERYGGGSTVYNSINETYVSVSSELKSGVAQVYATFGAFAAIKSDGSVVAWGGESAGGGLCLSPIIGNKCISVADQLKPVAAAKTCDDGNACTTDSCDKATGKCVFDGKAQQGKSCSDGDACTSNDVCSKGLCSGKPLACNDNDGCTTDSCSNGKCQHSASKNCNDNNQCTTDTCDKKTGKCKHSSTKAGAPGKVDLVAVGYWASKYTWKQPTCPQQGPCTFYEKTGIQFFGTIKNQGTAPTCGQNVAWEISADGKTNHGFLCTKKTGALAAGQTASVNCVKTLSASIKPGKYYLNFNVGVYSGYKENNYSNNFAKAKHVFTIL